MYYKGLDVHKKTISYCVKDAAGCVHQEGKIGSTRIELDAWIRTLPQPRTIAMEATIFTGWIYDHLRPHAQAVKVAHPLMLRAIALAKKKNDKIDAGKIADCLRRIETLASVSDLNQLTQSGYSPAIQATIGQSSSSPKSKLGHHPRRAALDNSASRMKSLSATGNGNSRVSAGSGS
jgi:hypothetical protein